jgi:hypothetical protein
MEDLKWLECPNLPSDLKNVLSVNNDAAGENSQKTAKCLFPFEMFQREFRTRNVFANEGKTGMAQRRIGK